VASRAPPTPAGRPLLLEGGLDWKSMSLSPKDLDFIEAKNSAAREIALALGVPPMLLGIPGDNTYSNMQEATRMFWRQTVLPLVARTAKALSGWLAPAYGSPIELRADLDGIEALSAEREALWTRIDKATFLTPNEKRAAAGYGPLGSGDEIKCNPDQPRVPAGQTGGGQWTDVGSGDAGRESEQSPTAVVDEPIRLAQVGGASTMTDTGLNNFLHGGAHLVAPSGQTLGTFVVSPLTNNVYATPFGTVDVTGWTAYYGPPGSTLDTGNGRIDYPTGVLWFIRPGGGQALARTVFSGQ
jgi:hypothetical protein